MALHLFFLAFFLCHSSVLVVSLNDEGFALLSFKEAIEHYQDWSLNNWNSSDTNPCSWNGVECNEEKVISLTIPNKMLSGFLHPALGTLVALRHVNLRNNKLYGGLPSELFNAKGLQSLVLSGNSFSGPVPSEIGNLNYLQILDLSNNSFNGSIPSSLGQCKRLKSLALGRNTFYGSLPAGFGINLTSLQNLNLSFNILSGSIPSSIGNLSSLQGKLDLSHNYFNGSIPASLGSLPETLYIDLSYNNLSGSIPENAVLLNSGPTAFIGNPLLCGTPLKVPCSASTRDGYDQSFARDPSQSSGNNSLRSGKGSSNSSVMARAMIGSIAGICLLGLVFTYWYKKVWTCKGLKQGGGCNCKEDLTIRNEISCFRRDYLETLSENPENYGFIPLDSNIDFDLDNLLKASAFLLGKSGIGILYKVALANGITVAVRRLGEGGSQRFREFQTEVEAIGKVRHPNIISLRAYCWSVDEKLLIYDYIPNGDLATAIHGKSGIVSYKPLPWPVRLRIIKGMAKGLAFLHEFSPKRYIHGNLKPNNVLLRENMEPCISDFGLGQLANISEEYMTEQTAAGTPVTPHQSYHFTTANLSSTRSYYQAPEASKVAKPSQKWDVYSYGVVVLELISAKSPTVQMGSLEMDLVRWIQLSIDVGNPLSAVLDPFLTRDLEVENEVFIVIKIALACVHKNPDKRPSMKYVSEYLARLASSA